VRDFPLAMDAITASITSTATTATVSAGTQFNASGNQIIEIDYEAFLLKSVSTNTLTVTRAYAGSTAATHASGATVLIQPAFMAVEIIDALNATKDECFPLIYKPVLDTSLSGDGTTYEFTVPNMPSTYGGDSIPIPWLSGSNSRRTGPWTTALSPTGRSVAEPHRRSASSHLSPIGDDSYSRLRPVPRLECFD
jgi:hypothetical protein